MEIISDSGRMEEIERLAEQVKTVTQTLDVIVINAGVGKFNSLENMSEALFDEIYEC